MAGRGPFVAAKASPSFFFADQQTRLKKGESIMIAAGQSWSLAHEVHMTGGAVSTVSWAEQWSPGLFTIILILAILYLKAVGSWLSRFADSEPVKLKHKLYVLIGLSLIYAAEGTPISYYGHHYLFSAHMLQQSLLYLMAPPLIICGLPAWLLRPLFRHPLADRLMKLWSNPLVALFVFNLVFSFYHIPLVMDRLMANELLMIVYNTVFFIAAFQMWYPLYGRLPEYSRMNGLKKMGYIFVNGILLTPACALIIFADSTMYQMYENAPAVFSWLSAIDDQQLGGVIMKIVQEFVYATALANAFFAWYRLERKDEDDELPMNPEESYTPISNQLKQV
jgi:putative membrane protein